MTLFVLALAQAAPAWPESEGFSVVRGVLALAVVVVALAAFVWVRAARCLRAGRRKAEARSPGD